MTASTSSARDPLDVLADEFVARLRRGEQPSVRDYAAGHPALAADIRDTFPVLLAMERAKPPAADGGPPVPAVPGYTVVGWVGGGGMGDVYEAVQEALGRRVALKVLRPRGRATDACRERFRREARAAGRLHHTHIVPVFDSGEAGGVLYYAMQFIPGRGLDAVVDEVRKLPAGPRGSTAHPGSTLTGTGGADYYRAVARVGADAADALAYAHRQGVLHRDVKPSNLLLDDRGTVWVADFGLAKAGDAGDLTDTGDIVGTVRYMAPERFDGTADARSDVYALGLTLYELATLRPAYDGPADASLIHRIGSEPPPSPRSVCPTVPRDLETVILKATARTPAHRYLTADALADDLRRFAAGQPVLARRVSAAEAVWRAAKRNPLVAGLVAAVVLVSLLGAAGSGWYAWRAGQNADRAERNEATARAALDALADETVSWMLARQTRPTDGERRFLDRVLALYERMANGMGDDPAARGVRAAGHLCTGRLHYLFGHTAEAEAAFRRAAADAGPADEGAARRWLADVLRETGRRADAEREYRAALELFDRCPAASTSRYEEVYAAKGLADVLGDIDRLEEAERMYRRAIRRAEELTAEFPDIGPFWQQLALVRHNLAGAVMRDRPAEQVAELGQALAIQERLLAAEPDHPALRVDVARTRRNYAVALAGRGQTVEAEAVRRRGLDVSRRLVAEFPADPEYTLMHVAGLEEAGYAALGAGRTGEAEDTFREAQTLCARAAVAHPGILPYQNQVVACDIGLGFAELAGGRPVAAAERFDRAATQAERLCANDPQWTNVRYLLAKALDGKACTLLAAGLPGDAVPHWDRALALDNGRVTAESALYRATANFRLNGDASAAAAAATAVGSPAAPAGVCDRAGLLLAAAAAADPPHREEYAGRAVEAFRRAAAGGYYRHPPHLGTLVRDVSGTSVADRADFRALVAELQPGGPPLEPAAPPRPVGR